jgi:hypothetical protein
MQVQLDDIDGGECLRGQIGEEQFVDDPRTRDANGALLFTSGMSCYDYTAQHPFRPHRDFRAIVEAAHESTFRTLLELIRR